MSMMNNPLLKHWQLTFVGIVLLLAIVMILINGIQLGMDFKGGTLYQIELQKDLSSDEISRMANIISQRIDPSGFKDATVYPVGTKFIVIQLAETDPAELEKIESRIRQQGRFESTLNGETVFTGDEIKKVLRSDTSYGIMPISKTAFEWSLPFILNEAATKRFTEKTFHQCTATGFSATGVPSYDCEKTVFFLDKPVALIVLTSDDYDYDASLFIGGNRNENIPADTDIEGIIQDSQLNVIVLDGNVFDSSKAQTAFLTAKQAVVSPQVNANIRDDLNSIGFEVIVQASKDGVPWIWTAMNAKQVISLTQGITNEDVSDISQAQQFSTLRISGQRETSKDAQTDLEELTILLESGSLPTPVKSISKETITASLGESFLSIVMLMGILALICVALIVIIRYRILKLAFPIILTGLAEIVIMLGFIAFFKLPLDLAAFAGIIASIGTGVDSEIVITDEILGKSKESHESLIKRAKAAMFIIATSAFTMIGVMGPILLFSRSMPGLEKLYGFALVAIVGALIGIFISRPAFTKVVEWIVMKKEEGKQ
jgi:preprotein translocase subunit SecD